MMRLSTDTRLLIGALIVITLLSIISLAVTPNNAPALSVRGDDAEGAMVLKLWLEENGYEVHELLSTPPELNSIDVLFILNPLTPYEDRERRTIYNWVREGNTLILAGSPFIINSLLLYGELELDFLEEAEDILRAPAPTLLSPPLDRIETEVFYGIETTRDDVVTHLTSNGNPVIVSFNEAQGTVWVSGITSPFSNRGLSDPNSARLILNLLANTSSGAVIGFDEFRHGYGAQAETLTGLLFGTSPGWGILSAVAVTVFYLALSGRRFGRPLPLPDERLRREYSEYILAMANLFRRSGQREAMLAHYRLQLSRYLSERYGVDPHANDTELLKMVIYRDPEIDETKLRDLLQRLSVKHVTETELLGAARAVDEWIKR